MIFQKRSKEIVSSPFKSTSLPFITLNSFPNEILLLILQNLDIITLLSVCNVSKRFHQVSVVALESRFAEPNLRLHLGFEQEQKWRFNVDFKFSHVNTQTGNLVFRPIKQQTSLRLFHSPLLRNPSISKISLSCRQISSSKSLKPKSSSNSLRNLPSTNAHHNNHHVLKLDTNFLQKSCKFAIKSCGEQEQQRDVYRIGHGSKHLQVSYSFKYTVETAPPTIRKLRGGERWITPISFECPASFFYPHEPTAHKVIMSLLSYRKTATAVTSSNNLRRKQNRNTEKSIFTFMSKNKKKDQAKMNDDMYPRDLKWAREFVL
ncbi:8953_t:CDS:2 [Ambispora leptoticha]|uniref:8953_t:CDS:1 n=1 Tax=Ambispora leptoticha TaxID=144679 RepID=A0A9N9F6Z3_9GLOM|nr:8953_t:CDS:2 [Ambispora leptoticha]